MKESSQDTVTRLIPRARAGNIFVYFIKSILNNCV
jgi:hypothetical protein